MPTVASLLASATEIVCALGLQDQLVAISHECDYPPDILHLPRLSRARFDPKGLNSGDVDRAVRAAMKDHGSVYQVDEAALARLQPGIILTQAVCEVCAVPTPGVRQLVARKRLTTQVLSLDAHTVDEIMDTVVQVGEALGESERAQALVAQFRRRLAHVHDAVKHEPKPNVLAIEWLDPPFAPGHWVPEMIALAGGTSLIGEAGRHSTQLSWSALAGHDPDVLIIMPCGYGLDASRVDAERHREQLRRVAPRAILQGRAFIVDGSSYFNRSGPRVIDGIEIMAGLLHPQMVAAPDPAAALPWH